MEFEQKAEEKKMSMSKNIARLAVTAGLTAALSFGGVMAPVTMAFAEDAAATTNIITINNINDNQGVKYKAYQIFKATVTDDKTEGKIAQNIEWANSELGNKVINAITGWSGYNAPNVTKLPDKPTAQDVAEFLMANADRPTAGSDDGTIKGTRVATNNVLYVVANAAKDVAPTTSGITARQPWNAAFGSGYYLFVTDESSLGADKKNTGTSPIFALVGGEAVTVTEKTSIPTVDKQILAATSDDPTKLTGWAGVADSQIGQEVTYKLTGKVADNYATYDSYAYKFTDTLSNGLDYVNGSLNVYAVNSSGNYTLIDDTFYQLTTSNDNRVLTVNFVVDKDNNKKGLKDVQGVDADTQIVVFYRAKLNKNAVTGNGDSEGKKGNYNTVKLEYSNNPSTEEKGTSVESGAGDFTFKLNLNKVDQGTEKGLKGAEFSIQSADADTLNQYVASKDSPDGTVVAGQLVRFSEKTLPDYLKFASDDKGKIEARGLDAGKYTVTEIKAPSGKYAVAKPFTFTITAKYKDNAVDLDEITINPSENADHRSDIAFGTLDKTPGDNTLSATNGTAANVKTGEINITVGNTKSVGLPLTGLNGVTFTWIAGGAVLCIGVAHLIRSRKQAEESEQE